MSEKLSYIVLFTAGSALALLKMLLAAHSVGPANFGQYALLIVAAAILSYINSAGIFEAFLVRLNHGRASMTERVAYRDSGLITSFGLSIVTAVLAIIVLYFLGPALPLTVVALVGLYFVINNLLNGLMVELQAGQRPVEYSACLVAKSAVPVALLAAGFGGALEGLLIFDLLAMGLIVAYLLNRLGAPSLGHVSIARVNELVREGIPFTANAAALNIGNNLDKWAVGFAVGATQLGLYAFAGQLITAGMAFASMVQIYMYPRIVAEMPGQALASALALRALNLAGISGLLCGLGIGVVISIGFICVPQLLPEYEAAFSIMPVLGCAAIIIGANHAEIFFRLTGHGKAYFFIQLHALAVTGVAYGILIFFGQPLIYFALAFALGRLVQCVAGYSYAFFLAHRIAVIGS